MERNWKELYEQGKIVNGLEGFQGDFEFLSNFCRHDSVLSLALPYGKKNAHQVISDNIEILFQAAKVDSWHDLAFIIQCKTPGQAKRNGRRIKLREDWEENKDKIMEDLVRQKFTRLPIFRQKLLSIPDDMYIVEMNYWNDTYWGVNKRTFEGENRLGEILMKIRSELRSQK
jgi:ribA/ribD-fused uncharacterized protein